MAEQKGIQSTVPNYDKGIKSPNVFEGQKEASESASRSDKSPHDEETHGTSDDIDESTPIDEVKGPSVFQRVKEEVEALVGSAQPKK